jgi:omega-amidase
MDDLRITLVQGDTRWHDPAGNRAYYGGLIAPLAGRTDLVVLPETFTSGFSNEALVIFFVLFLASQNLFFLIQDVNR